MPIIASVIKFLKTHNALQCPAPVRVKNFIEVNFTVLKYTISLIGTIEYFGMIISIQKQAKFDW